MEQQTSEIRWRPIKGYESIYHVSDTGLIKALKYYGKCGYAKVLKHKPGKYKRITLCKDAVKTEFYIHRLVAEHFVDNPKHELYDQVNQ